MCVLGKRRKNVHYSLPHTYTGMRTHTHRQTGIAWQHSGIDFYFLFLLPWLVSMLHATQLGRQSHYNKFSVSASRSTMGRDRGGEKGALTSAVGLMLGRNRGESRKSGQIAISSRWYSLEVRQFGQFIMEGRTLLPCFMQINLIITLATHTHSHTHTQPQLQCMHGSLAFISLAAFVVRTRNCLTKGF